jgi:arylsulfatase B
VFEGGVRGVGVVYGRPLSKVGYVNTALFHVSDWMPTLLAAASEGAPTTTWADWSAVDGVPWKDGDGVNNWHALSHDTQSTRNEIAHAAQAEGSLLHAWALRLGDMKLIYGNNGSVNGNQLPLWYPPPGLSWNYSSSLTVHCAKPPTTLERAGACTNETAPCLFNISADPCEHINLAEQMPDIVSQLMVRLRVYQRTTVLTWCAPVL